MGSAQVFGQHLSIDVAAESYLEGPLEWLNIWAMKGGESRLLFPAVVKAWE